MPGREFVENLLPNQFIEGVFAIQNCQLGVTKAGKSYLKCLLGDRTGRLPGRMWNTSEDLFAQLPTDGFVQLQGQTQPYQGEMQIIIQQIRAVTPDTDELVELLPSTDRDIESMFNQVVRVLDSLTSPPIKALARAYLDDAELMNRFRQAPAAQQLHHAYLGGLLEHTLSLLKVAEAVLPLYPQVNRETVLMGLFLHDLGKCSELNWKTGFSYSDDGQLVGHIARGVVWLRQKAAACAEAGTQLSEELIRILEHGILSHHGLPEHGALKIPATPEAILVSQLDNLDAKMQMALDACRRESGKAEELGGNF
ncbi:MAG: HD domain-containing protein, partial [Phycisphaerae bacterium]|nr:HD domain-containing protein [Phycisphaerae bacterium]